MRDHFHARDEQPRHRGGSLRGQRESKGTAARGGAACSDYHIKGEKRVREVEEM